MRIYLDVCCLNRPYDDQSQERIRMETEAILLVLAGVQEGDFTLVSSEALELEVRRTDDALLKRATKHAGKMRIRVANPSVWVLERKS